MIMPYYSAVSIHGSKLKQVHHAGCVYVKIYIYFCLFLADLYDLRLLSIVL